MRRFSCLSPFVVIAFLGALPSLAKEPVQPQQDYLAPGQVDLLKLLPPPPAPGSEIVNQDMRAVLDAQRHRDTAVAARAKADAEISIFRFADVLGPQFTGDKLPKLTAFFARVRHSEVGPVTLVKDYWQRPRPFVGNAKIHPLPEAREGVLNDDKHTYSYSFPSGHATFGATCAIILANMVPEKRAELFARGWQYGTNRMMAGVHFPTDIEAGRIDAAVLVYAMMQNPEFQKDFADAKAELRGVLGLAP